MLVAVAVWSDGFASFDSVLQGPDNLQPDNARETALLTKIDDAFARTINANANVTAYLKSLLKVEEMQDRVDRWCALNELVRRRFRLSLHWGLLSGRTTSNLIGEAPHLGELLHQDLLSGPEMDA